MHSIPRGWIPPFFESPPHERYTPPFKKKCYPHLLHRILDFFDCWVVSTNFETIKLSITGFEKVALILSIYSTNYLVLPTFFLLWTPFFVNFCTCFSRTRSPQFTYLPGFLVIVWRIHLAQIEILGLRIRITVFAYYTILVPDEATLLLVTLRFINA